MTAKEDRRPIAGITFPKYNQTKLSISNYSKGTTAGSHVFCALNAVNAQLVI